MPPACPEVVLLVWARVSLRRLRASSDPLLPRGVSPGGHSSMRKRSLLEAAVRKTQNKLAAVLAELMVFPARTTCNEAQTGILWDRRPPDRRGLRAEIALRRKKRDLRRSEHRNRKRLGASDLAPPRRTSRRLWLRGSR